jgi:hypothetical protein
VIASAHAASVTTNHSERSFNTQEPQARALDRNVIAVSSIYWARYDDNTTSDFETCDATFVALAGVDEENIRREACCGY